MKARKRTERLRYLFVCLIVFFILGSLVAGGKIFFYQDAVVPWNKVDQIIQEEKTEEGIGQKSFNFPENNFVKRKNIYDRNLKELALSFMLASVYVKPLEIRKEEGAIGKLSELLGLNEKEVALSIASERGFVWIERNIDREMVDKIEKLKISGVYLVKESVRFNPKGKLASHIIGFSEGEQGLAGVEAYYDNILAGNTSSESANMQAAGIAPEKYMEKDGASLILTIDLQIQDYLEKKLAAVIIKHEARSGVAMIIHSRSGEVLALTNYPTYDSNVFWKYDSFERRNRLLTDPVKLGAFLHLVRMAVEMEQGNVPEYISEPEEIAEIIIEPKNLKKLVSEKYRQPVNPIWKTLAKGVYWPVVDKPFNFMLDAREMQDFSVAYGFTERGFIDLPMNGLFEAGAGDEPKMDLTDFNSSATGLQILTAFNRLVNGGKRVVPHVLKEIWFEKEGEKVSASFEQGLIEEKQESNRRFIRLIHELSAVPQKSEVLFETIIEEKDDAIEQGLEFSQETDSATAAGALSSVGQVSRCQGIALGAIPSLDPEIAMIMVVEGMKVDLSGPSYLHPTISTILKNGLQIYHSDTSDNQPDLRLQERELFEKWSKVHATGDSRNISKSSNQVQMMPTVLNMSFRKALQVLQNYNVRIRVEGSGRVVAQHPAPGTRLQGTRDCVLELKVDN